MRAGNLDYVQLERLLRLAQIREAKVGVHVSWQRRFYCIFLRGPTVWQQPAAPFPPEFAEFSPEQTEEQTSSWSGGKMSKRSGFQMRSFCRFRPLPATAKETDNTDWYQCDKSKGEVTVSEPDGTSQSYEFNNILRPGCTQAHVYVFAAQEAVRCAFDGVNSTLFCYGQTGSGKTHTMFGPDSHSGYGMQDPTPIPAADVNYALSRDRTGMPIPRLRSDGQASSGRDLELSGIVPRACRDLLACSVLDLSVEVQLTVSYMEIYQDKVYDLLQHGVVLQLGDNVADSNPLGRELTPRSGMACRLFKPGAMAILASSYRSYTTADTSEAGGEGEKAPVPEGSRLSARAELKHRLASFGPSCIWREVTVVDCDVSKATYTVQLGPWFVFTAVLVSGWMVV